jgi:hypothetical protein
MMFMFMSQNISSMTTNFTEYKCPLTIRDQEDFMHRLFDVVHIGVSFDSFTLLIERYSTTHNIEKLLNSRMKNEKYSDSYDFPLAKVITETRGISQDKGHFYNTKMRMINHLIKLGANPQVINEKYMDRKMNLDFLLMTGAIDNEIYNELSIHKQ